jgi:amphi-Trp domain-containing protein
VQGFEGDTEEEPPMEILKIQSEELVSREGAAARLHAIADALAAHNDVEMEWEGKRLTVRVADQVTLEVEIEVDEDKTELEIELKWRR